MSTRRSRPLIEDMLSYAREAAALVENRAGPELSTDRMRFLAVSRAVEVVGEAAAQVPESIRTAIPDVPFRQASAMRNRLIHGYGHVSANILADTVRTDFPLLIRQLEAALSSSLPDDNQSSGD